MKILLIGMNGFLGKNLSEKIIKENFQILSIVRNIKFKPKNFTIIKDDIGHLKTTSLKKIKKFKPEVIINLAWHGIPDFSLQNSLKNFLAHINFIEKISTIKSIKKIIMIGSSWEYLPKTGNCLEGSRTNYLTPFSWAKNSLYNYIKDHSYFKNVKFVWLRVFFMYGKYQKNSSLIPHIFKQLKKNKKPKILSPNASNDFIHVDDVCRAIILAIKKKNISGIFNVGFGKLILVKDIYYTILKLLEKNQTKYKLTSRLYKNSKKENYANIKKIRQKLNFKPKINIIDGINKL